MERQDAWERLRLKLATATRSVRLSLPPTLEILRPGEEPKRPANVVSIAEFAQMHEERKAG